MIARIRTKAFPCSKQHYHENKVLLSLFSYLPMTQPRAFTFAYLFWQYFKKKKIKHVPLFIVQLSFLSILRRQEKKTKKKMHHIFIGLLRMDMTPV